jgi:hypothetical protein
LGKTETSTYYALTCDRDSVSQIDWNNVDGNGIRTLCDYNAQLQVFPATSARRRQVTRVGGVDRTMLMHQDANTTR